MCIRDSYQRFTEGLEAEVLRSGWQVIAFCWMPNHIHALLKTPEPNLANGMQHWLSGYANLIKKAKKMIKDAKPFKKQYNQIKQHLLKTENQV